MEGNYRIIYQIRNEKEILTTTIHHSACDLRNRKLNKIPDFTFLNVTLGAANLILVIKNTFDQEKGT